MRLHRVNILILGSCTTRSLNTAEVAETARGSLDIRLANIVLAEHLRVTADDIHFAIGSRDAEDVPQTQILKDTYDNHVMITLFLVYHCQDTVHQLFFVI